MTDDSSYLVSGGDDAVVSVWSVLDVVDADDNAAASVVRDFHSWSDHSQAVTALHVGRGGVRGRVFSASLDRTARVFEIFSRQLVYTVSCDVFITAVVTTPDESWLLVGAGDGTIIAADLRAAACGSSGGLAGGVVMEGAQSQERLEGHTHPVCSLLCVDQGTLLVSASEDGTVKTWDFASRQCIQTTDLKAPITCMVAAGTIDPSEFLRAQPADTDLALFAPLRKFGSTGKPDAAHCFLPLKRSFVDNETEKPAKQGS
jgi:pre-rRNA-processing protein IPI3